MEQMNYTLGRGELYFNKFKSGTQTGTGDRYFGNTPGVTLNIQTDNLDHYNSDRGVKEKDASVALQTNRTGNFTTDHISPENLALFFFGSVNALTVAAATGLTSAFDAVKIGYFYQLGQSAANPMGDQNVSNVVVKDDAATPATFVLGTDYMLAPDLGRVEPLEGGAIVDGVTNLRVTYDVAGSTRELIVSGTTPIEGSLRYVAQNPVGDKIDYFFPWVKITPNGDFALKGDEWQVIPFNIEVLKRTGYEAIYASKRAVTA
jgi:hypothetical protein